MEFFSLKKLHHVFKYTEYDELTSQLCIQGITRNICVFLLWVQSHRRPNIKEEPEGNLQLKKKQC